MYIKNITQMLKENTPIKYRFFEGNTISGKIISLTDGKGAIKLYDGNIIPATFLFEQELEKDKFTTFKIEKFDGNSLVLKALKDNAEDNRENIASILNRLNITDETAGRDIIISLMKFGLPANDENILFIYKNKAFLNNLKNISDSKLLMLLKENISDNIDYGSKEFNSARELILKLTNTDADLFSFLIENNMAGNVDNVLKMQVFNNKTFLLNLIFKKLGNYNKEAMSQNNLTANESINKNDKFINVLSRFLEKYSGSSNGKIISFKNVQEYIKKNPKVLSLLSKVEIKDFKSNLDVIKNINKNYDILFFNYQVNGKIYKNKIIIKDKYKDIDYKKTNNIKMYLTVDTPLTGIVEAYIYKNKNTMAVQFNVDKNYIDCYKKYKDILNENLKRLGYNVVDISFVKYKKVSRFTDLSGFFNDTIYKELDVLV
jgi:hypothetical protein